MLTTGQKIIRARMLFGAWADTPRDVSQTELAELIGVTQGSVGHWEADRRRPDADSYKALARILGVNLGWLMADQGPMYDDDAMRPTVQPPIAVSDDSLDAEESVLRQSVPRRGKSGARPPSRKDVPRPKPRSRGHGG